MRRDARNAWLRRLTFSAGAAALAVAALWLAAAPVVGLVVERELRLAGFADPSVTGVSLAPPDVSIERVRLAQADELVLEDVRARIGTSGVENLRASRLRLDAEIGPDGTLALPGLESSGAGPLPLGLVPPEGIRLADAEIRLRATPAGEVNVTLSDVEVTGTPGRALIAARFAAEHSAARLAGEASAEIASDGSIRSRLDVEDGRVHVAGLEAAGLAGDVLATRPASGTLELTLELGSNETSVADIGVGALALDATWREGVAELALTSTGSTAAEISLEGRAALSGASPSADLSGRVALDGTQARGEIELDAEVSGAPDGGPGLAGRVRLTGRGLALKDLLDAGAFDVAGAIDGDLESLRLTATDEWTLELSPAFARMPSAMRVLAGRDVSIGLAPRDGAPLILELDLPKRSARLDAHLDARAGESRLRGAARLAASWASGAAITADDVQLAAEDLPWAGISLDVSELVGAAAYSAGRWRFSGTGVFDASGSVAGATLEGSTARWSGTIAGTPESLVAEASDCIAWSAAAVELAEIRLESVTLPCLRPREGDALLTYDRDARRARLGVSTDQGPLRLRLVPPRDASAIDVAFDGVEASVEVADGAIASAAMSVTSIEHAEPPALWAPAGLEASAARDGGGLSFEAVLSDDLGSWVLEAAGRHGDGRGRASVTLYPIRFVPGATEVADLSPRLAEHVVDASGTVGFDGELAWGEEGVQSTGNLTLEGFGAIVSGVAVSGVDTRTAFDALLPPVTSPDQRVEIGGIDLGVPLERGLLVYDLDAAGRFSIDRLEIDFAGGRLFAEPFTVDSASPGDIGFALRAEEVELSQMLALSRIDGLEGTGVLSGRVPIRVSAQGVTLDEGVLAAETDGVLRYTPDELPSFLRGDDVRSRMLREALTNFRYEELSIGLTGEPGEAGAQRLTLSAQGANPDFLEGHPIELNFNFQGPLLAAVRSAVDLSGAVEVRDTPEQPETDPENDDGGNIR